METRPDKVIDLQGLHQDLVKDPAGAVMDHEPVFSLSSDQFIVLVRPEDEPAISPRSIRACSLHKFLAGLDFNTSHRVIYDIV